MVNRVIRDDPSKGDMHNRQPITPKLLWKSMKDYDMWPLYAIGLTFLIPATPPTQYFTLTLRSLGFNVLVTNLLTIPNTVLQMGGLLLLTYLSEKWNERAFTAMAVQFYKLPFLVTLYLVDITALNRWVAYAIIALLLSAPTGRSITKRLRPPIHELTSSSPSRTSQLELTQLQRGPSTHCLRSSVQHDRTVCRHYRQQCVPRRRRTSLSPW